MVSSNLHWSEKYYASAIQTNDATGYYAYLPAVFIYHDLNFAYHDSVIQKYYNPEKYADYRVTYNGKTIDKYYAGTAFTLIPFFLAGHLYAKLFNYPADGYSLPYFIAINIASIVFLLMGLIYILKFLKSYGATEKASSLILIVLVFATNLFHYASSEPCLSHIYSFAFISAFVYHSKKFFSGLAIKDFLFCSLCLGFIIFIRPVNIIVIFSLPFLAGDFNKLKTAFNKLINDKSALIFSALITLSIAAIQPVIYQIQCGSFFVYTYFDEGFNWTNPQLINFLFSYRKGFFVYTPVALLSLPGFVFLWRKNKFQFYSLLFFLSLLIYILSSWWNWWYGGSFSTRVLLDYYVFLALLFMFAYQLVESKLIKNILIPVCFSLIVLCQIQAYQYRYYVINNEGMTKEEYWDVFLKLKK